MSAQFGQGIGELVSKLVAVPATAELRATLDIGFDKHGGNQGRRTLYFECNKQIEFFCPQPRADSV
jgi:hypothetical protein